MWDFNYTHSAESGFTRRKQVSALRPIQLKSAGRMVSSSDTTGSTLMASLSPKPAFGGAESDGQTVDKFWNQLTVNSHPAGMRLNRLPPPGQSASRCQEYHGERRQHCELREKPHQGLQNRSVGIVVPEDF